MQWTTWCLLAGACGGGEASSGTEAATTTGGGPSTSTTVDTPTGSGSGAGTSTTSGMTGTGEAPTTGTSTTGSDTGETTQPASISDTSSGTSTDGTTGTGTTDTTGTTGDPPPVVKLCSADLHSVVDDMGQLLASCGADEGCLEGACVPACAAAAGSKANFGCAFIVPTPPAYPPALPPCFAVFLANTVRPNPPRRPPTSRSAAIPGKRAFRRGRARPTLAQRAPVRPGFWQRFGNALATRASRTEAHRPEVFDTARARPRRTRGSIAASRAADNGGGSPDVAQVVSPTVASALRALPLVL